MILIDALRLNNQGVLDWNTLLSGGGSASVEEIPEEGTEVCRQETTILNCFTASLTSVQNDIRELSSIEHAQLPQSTEERRPAISFRARPVEAFRSVVNANPNQRFVFHRAFEAFLVEEDEAVADLGIDDAVACSACVIFNMALVHHLRFLRDPEDSSAKNKAESLYGLALQALDGAALPSANQHSGLEKIFQLVQLGALNNLGALKSSQDTACNEDARSCFVELMRVLNSVEQQAKCSGLPTSDSLLHESEWNGMTSNCLAILFNMPTNQKTALAA